jgi:hypothetical protein
MLHQRRTAEQDQAKEHVATVQDDDVPLKEGNGHEEGKYGTYAGLLGHQFEGGGTGGIEETEAGLKADQYEKPKECMDDEQQGYLLWNWDVSL